MCGIVPSKSMISPPAFAWEPPLNSSRVRDEWIFPWLGPWLRPARALALSYGIALACTWRSVWFCPWWWYVRCFSSYCSRRIGNGMWASFLYFFIAGCENPSILLKKTLEFCPLSRGARVCSSCWGSGLPDSKKRYLLLSSYVKPEMAPDIHHR